MNKRVWEGLKKQIQIKIPKLENSILAPHLWNYIKNMDVKRGEEYICKKK